MSFSDYLSGKISLDEFHAGQAAAWDACTAQALRTHDEIAYKALTSTPEPEPVVLDDMCDGEPASLDGLAMPEIVGRETLPSGAIYTVFANGMTLLQMPAEPPKPDHPAPLNDLSLDSAMSPSVKWWNR